jgi:hypothetical protein
LHATAAEWALHGWQAAEAEIPLESTPKHCIGIKKLINTCSFIVKSVMVEKN